VFSVADFVLAFILRFCGYAIAVPETK